MELKIGNIPILVDEEDFPKIFNHKWHLFKSRGNLYIRGWNENLRKKVFLHRIILEVYDKRQVDHINGNTLDNRKCNLRICNSKENIRNRPKHATNTSGYKGVFAVAKCLNKWRVLIGVDNKRTYIGVFDSKIEAAKAYNEAAIKYFGEFANLNKL